MDRHSTLSLFDDVIAPPAPAVARPHSPVPDEAMALALIYEQAVLDCLESFKGVDNIRAQAEACSRFADAMEAYMALPKSTYQRTKRELDRRGKISGREWQLIEQRMITLSRIAPSLARRGDA